MTKDNSLNNSNIRSNNVNDKVYYRCFTPNSGESLALVAKHIAEGSRVLDIGCGAGDLGDYLQKQKQCRVVGVDYSAESVAVAAQKLETVIQLDLNVQTLDKQVEGTFDVIVMADILEHIHTADAVLRSAENYLTASGKILISIPNAGYVGALLSLYDDAWRYREEGILDRTHVRFYTKQSVMELLRDNGYEGRICDRVSRDLLDSEFTQRLDCQADAVRDWLLAKPEGSTYQFIVEARPQRQQYPFPDEPVALPMSLQHIVKCYWQNHSEASFNESYYGITRGQMGQQNTLRFRVGAGAIHKLRVDFADRRGIYHFDAIRIFDGKACCWTSHEYDYTLTLQKCFSSKQQLPLTAMAHDNQASVVVNLPKTLDGNDLVIEIVLSAPVGEQNIAFCDAVSLSAYHTALQEQQRLACELSTLRAEASARITYLEEVLSSERQQLTAERSSLPAEREQYIVEVKKLTEEKQVLDRKNQQLDNKIQQLDTEKQLSMEKQQQYSDYIDELKAQLTMAETTINQLHHESENSRQHIQSLLQSNSWKLTAPLRRITELLR